MLKGSEDFLLMLLQACAESAPEPLYPTRFAREKNLDRDELDRGLDELRRRGLMKLTDWVKDLGQGRALTMAGETALKTRNLAPAPVAAEKTYDPAADETGAFGRGEAVRNAVFYPATAWVTRVLLVLNIGYFLFGAAFAIYHDLNVADYLAGRSMTTSVVLTVLGALRPFFVFPPEGMPMRPEYERLVLFLFLHIGVFHLLMNMYFLGSIGPLIESMWGSFRFFLIYFVSGLVSGCVILMIAHMQDPGGRSSFTAGASGALYGIFVSFVVWFLLNRRHLPDEVIQGWQRNIGTNVVLLIVINFLPGLSWQGHLGGAIGGLLAALMLHVQRFNPSSPIRWLALIVTLLIPVGFFLAVLRQWGQL